MQPVQVKREEEAIVLDFLQNGYTADPRPLHLKDPIAQALGTSRFTLLELIPKKEIPQLQPLQKVYIGDQHREEIHHVNGKIRFDKLTATAQSQLASVVAQLVAENPERFVAFYNSAQPLSLRTHSLELLPGVGKKHMQELLEARRDAPFESFDDIRKRVKLTADPEKLIVNRIMEEIRGNEKHFLFVALPPSDEDLAHRRGPPRRDNVGFGGHRRF
jgi:putative nucleotide binding protein